MKKVLAILALFSFLGASYALAWGNPFLSPQQNYNGYMTCLNTAKNGSDKQKLLANWACETYYGVTTAQ